MAYESTRGSNGYLNPCTRQLQKKRHCLLLCTYLINIQGPAQVDRWNWWMPARANPLMSNVNILCWVINEGNGGIIGGTGYKIFDSVIHFPISRHPCCIHVLLWCLAAKNYSSGTSLFWMRLTYKIKLGLLALKTVMQMTECYLGNRDVCCKSIAISIPELGCIITTIHFIQATGYFASFHRPWQKITSLFK